MMFFGASGLGCDKREALMSDCLIVVNASAASWLKESYLFSFEVVRRL